MSDGRLNVREAGAEDFAPLGRLMVAVYSGLEGFPKPQEQPRYYEMLADMGRFATRKDVKILVGIAWQMYERLGFKRSEDLDFKQEGLPVFGFRLELK